MRDSCDQGSTFSKAQARRMLRAADDCTFVTVMQTVIKRCGRNRWLSIEEAAELADISVRGLQRKLAHGGVVFGQLVDQARAEMALEMIKDTDFTVKEVAAAVGYSTSSNFARAFQRWTGVTPAQFQRSGNGKPLEGNEDA